MSKLWGTSEIHVQSDTADEDAPWVVTGSLESVLPRRGETSETGTRQDAIAAMMTLIASNLDNDGTEREDFESDDFSRLVEAGRQVRVALGISEKDLPRLQRPPKEL